ncbi:MAG: triphosphoribosyl-dephospho-CoA synthase [Halopenitus sp.]
MTPPSGPLPAPERSPVDNAQLALLLEVAGTPKPGNVDRARDLDDLRFEHFLTGAVGARDGLERAASGARVGHAFERAVAGMGQQGGGNTQFGCLLLLAPLVRTVATESTLSPSTVDRVVQSTTVDDAVDFYRAFEHVDVAVGDPPSDAPALDVRRGADAEPALRDRELSLYDVMTLSAEPDEGVSDANATEWVGEFSRSFAAAEDILADAGAAPDRVARAFLRLLAEAPDTLVATHHDADVAHDVMHRADAVGDDLGAAEELAEEFREEEINPGTTADLTCAATFIALERGLEL